MTLNDFGRIAHDDWLKTPQLRPKVALGACIIMPNHMHGIIHILDRRGELHSPKTEDHSNAPIANFELHSPDKMGEHATPNALGEFNSPLRCTSQAIGSIVRGYKSSVTKQLGLFGFREKLWQRNYYEHIIKNEQSYYNISEYIKGNAKNWETDTFKSFCQCQEKSV